MRRRLDAELVRRRLVRSPEEARAAIADGSVTVGSLPTTNASRLVADGEPVAISRPRSPYVSRGGEKLAAALDRFRVNPAGRDCLDAGASTGGFTDCLLTRGASRVAAVDVGYGQLDWRLRTDERVLVFERTDVRNVQPAWLPFRPHLVTADLSFISLRLALPALVSVAAAGADIVVLVKPQFEAARGDVGPGGVVRDPAVWRTSITSVMEAGIGNGLAPRALMPSPLTGPAGNVEFLLHGVKAAASGHLDVAAAVDEALALRGST